MKVLKVGNGNNKILKSNTYTKSLYFTAKFVGRYRLKIIIKIQNDEQHLFSWEWQKIN